MKKLILAILGILVCGYFIFAHADDRAVRYPTGTPIDVMSSNASGYSTTKNITAGYFNGNGSLLTGISAGGGYVNFSTNETANISWPHTFNATQLQVNGTNVTVGVPVNGTNGTNGVNGTNGTNGVSVSNASVNASGFLNITLSNSTVLGPWNVTGPIGLNGTPGINGTNGTGTPGVNGTNGTNGVSVSNASVNVTGFLNITLSNSTVLGPWNVTGPAGTPGINGTNGSNGVNGTNGTTFTTGSGLNLNVTNVLALNSTLPAVNGSALTGLDTPIRANVSAGSGLTYNSTSGAFSLNATLPSTNLSAGTALNATNIATGTVPIARLPQSPGISLSLPGTDVWPSGGQIVITYPYNYTYALANITAVTNATGSTLNLSISKTGTFGNITPSVYLLNATAWTNGTNCSYNTNSTPLNTSIEAGSQLIFKYNSGTNTTVAILMK